MSSPTPPAARTSPKAIEQEEGLHEILGGIFNLRIMRSTGLNGGLTIFPAYAAAIRTPPVDPWSDGRPTWCIPITIHAGDQPVAKGHLTVTEPLSPLGACSGLLQLHLRDASDGTRTLNLQLIHALSGS